MVARQEVGFLSANWLLGPADLREIEARENHETVSSVYSYQCDSCIALMVTVVAGANAATSTSLSADNQQAMQTAEQLYRNGQYALAAETYQQVADQGFADSDALLQPGAEPLCVPAIWDERSGVFAWPSRWSRGTRASR